MPFDETFERLSGIGASSAYDAANWRAKLYYDILGQRQGKEFVPRFKGNLRTKIGQATEDITRDLGAEEYGLELLPHDGKTKRHPSLDHIYATADGLVRDIDAETGEIATLEIKLVGFGPHLDWGGSHYKPGGAKVDDDVNALPNRVRAQMAVQMAVEGTQAALCLAQMGTDIQLYRVARDLRYEQELFSRIKTFWDWVVAEEGFPIGPDAATKSYLSRKWTRTTHQIETDEDAAALIKEREDLKMRSDELLLEKSQVENLLRERIADRDGIDCPGVGRATFLFDKRGRRTLRVKLYGDSQ